MADSNRGRLTIDASLLSRKTRDSLRKGQQLVLCAGAIGVGKPSVKPVSLTFQRTIVRVMTEEELVKTVETLKELGLSDYLTIALEGEVVTSAKDIDRIRGIFKRAKCAIEPTEIFVKVTQS